MFRIALVLIAFTCFAQDAVVQLDGGVFRVAGWKASAAAPAAGWESVLAVYAGEGEAPPMVGSYSVENGVLSFRPRYPLSAGLRVRAVFRPPSGSPIHAAFETAKAAPRAPTTQVAHIYPSTDLLPENQLKLYIYFSAPMQKGEAWSRIHLFDPNGTRVELPFVEIDHELWDRDNRRLTVLFDPGRIKRGVLPLREIGPSIESGKSYTLVIDREWLDHTGTPLTQGYRKPFRVGPPDREPIDTAKWKIAAPRSGTVEPVTIDFPEPLDYALLQHFLQIEGVEGAVSVDRKETRWRFTPAKPWQDKPHQIIVRTILEDLAGNKIGRPFDVDTFEKITRTVVGETVSLSFRPNR